MDAVEAIAVDGRSSPVEVNLVIIDAAKERLEESPESLDASKGPVTVLESCEDEKRLITLVRRHPVLYDGRHPRFKDDAHKEQLWQRIANSLNIELTQCLVSWCELRYRYQKHVRRLRAFHRSAVQPEGTVRKRPCMRHEEELLFLYPHVARFPLLKAEASADASAESEGEAAVDVEFVEPPPVDIIDVDLVEDAFAFRCTSDHRRLIEAVSAYPQLYDPLHPQFVNFRHRGLIWGSISNELRDKATKLIKSWLKLLTRYEWEVTHSAVYCSESELCQLMTFLRPHVLRMRGSVCKASKYLSTGWHEPIENFRSVLALINAMRALPDFVQLVEDCMTSRSKPGRYDELWLKVDKAVGLGSERCEVTWLVLRSFHNELLAMRHAGYQLQDKWYFENALNGIMRMAAARMAKRGQANSIKRPFNGDATGEPPAKLAPQPQPVKEPVRLPMAIVYPPAMKNNSSTGKSGAGSGSQTLPNARSSTGVGLATNISSSAGPELPLQTFVIPTISGAVRVSHPAVKLPSPIKILPIASVGMIPQRPGLQITRCSPLRMPPGQMHPVVPPGIIRAPLNQSGPRYNPPMSALGALLSDKPKMPPPPVKPAPPAPAPALPQMPKLVPRMPLNVVASKVASEPAAPMVRIHQPGLQMEWEAMGSTSLPVLTPATARAGAGGATTEPGTSKAIANAPTGAGGGGAGTEAATEATPISISVYPERPATTTLPSVMAPLAPPAPKAPQPTASAPKVFYLGPIAPAVPPPPPPPAAAAAVQPARNGEAPQKTSPQKTPPPETPPAADDDGPSTSKEARTDFGSNPRGIHMNAINVNMIHSPCAGNSLHIWGGGLHCNYHLNMVRAATLIREVMAVPQLHSKDPQLKAKCDGFWEIISQKFHMPEVALRACWNFLANNMSMFPLIAPMSELMRPFKGTMKVWEKSNRLFSKFDEIARKYDWMKHKDVMPDLIRHFRQHEHLYWELRKPRPGERVQSPRIYTDKERQEVWREAKIKFPDLNHHDIWSMFKFAFRTYMEDLERGIENPWPQNWWQALEQLKFLADVHYHPLEPYYYIVHNKILEEVKRCSMFEALACSDSGDKTKTTALLARISKEPMPWCSEEAKRLLNGQLNKFANVEKAGNQAAEPVPVPDIMMADKEAPEPLQEVQEPATKSMPEPQLIPPPRRQKKNVVRRPAYALPTIEAFELTRMLRRYPHTFLRAHTINKRTAWVRVSKELKITVTECRLGLQYAVREMRILKILDPTGACTMGQKYYRHMEDIFKQVKTKSSLTVRTPQQMNQSISEPPEEVEPHKFVPEINMSTCKPGLVLKNWAYAVGNLSKESQESLTLKLTQLFAKYAKCAKTGNISLAS